MSVAPESESGGRDQVVPINVFVKAASQHRANNPGDSTQPAQPVSPTTDGGGIAGPSADQPTTPATNGIASPDGQGQKSIPSAAVLFDNSGDGVNTTRHHHFPLPGPLLAYAPEYEKGKYLVPSVTGESMFDTYERATTVAKSVEETSKLNDWKIRQVLKGLRSMPELFDGVDVEDNSWYGKKKVNRVADAAQVVAGSSRAGEFGDCVHAWSAAVEQGQRDFSEVPAEFKPYVEVYLRKLAEYGIRTAAGMIERVVYNSVTGVCGSFDRIYVLSDGTAVIGDLKTSASIDLAWLAISIQLAMYASASALLSEDGKTWVRMPAVSQTTAVVAHIPSNASPPVCTLRTVNLVAGAYALDLANNLRAARENALDVIPGDLPQP